MASWSGSGSQVVNDVSGRWIRLNWQIDSDDPGFSTTSINWRLRVWLQASYSISDSSNSFSISGSWSRSGSVAISIPSGGGTQLIYDNTNTDSGLGWGSGSSRSFSASISGLYNYGKTASTSGSGSVTVPTPSAPSAPGISVDALGNGYVDFSFSAPGYGGDGGVSFYESSTDNVNWGTQSSNPFRHYGSNGNTVYGYIRAVNAYGQRGPSAGTSGVPRTVPGAPNSVTSTPYNGYVSIAYTAPTSDGGESIDYYQYSTNNSTWTGSLASPIGNPFSVPGTNGTALTVYVRAVNAAGGGASKSTTSTPRTVPGPPRNLNGNNTVFGQISLSWSAPTSNGGSTITGYTLKRGTTTLFTNSNQTTYTDTGLLPYTDYTYTVSAVNVAGTGTETTPYVIKTLGGIAKIWNGSTYVTVLPKIWNGSVWVDSQARMWNGTEWKHGI